MVKCPYCGERQWRSGKENITYEAGGLPGVTLAGVRVSRCRHCGEYEVSVPNIEGLHRNIAQAITAKRARLVPEEVRFLRKYLGWSGGDFAAHMGTTAETVSRWEHGKAQIGPQADRLLRLMVRCKQPVESYELSELKQIARTAPKPMRTRFRLRGQHEWVTPTTARQRSAAARVG